MCTDTGTDDQSSYLFVVEVFFNNFLSAIGDVSLTKEEIPFVIGGINVTEFGPLNPMTGAATNYDFKMELEQEIQ